MISMRAPATPLITVDPYFSIWAMADELNKCTTRHWTTYENTLIGTVVVDGERLRFMGTNDDSIIPQKSVDINAMNTVYRFANEKIELTADFLSPLLPDSLYYLSRPVSYLALSYRSLDGKKHKVSFEIEASEELCLDKKGDGKTKAEKVDIDGITAIRIGNEKQEVLNRCGDDLRIDWGYFYLCLKGKGNTNSYHSDKLGMDMISISGDMTEVKKSLVLFAYDDINSIEYFGKHLEAYWKKFGRTIEEEIAIAAGEYEELLCSAMTFSDAMYLDAVRAGGEEYADLLTLSYRQVIVSHKLVMKNEKEILFISKECYSNGCAATADVSYPSIPFFLIYNPKLIEGMMIPIFDYAASKAWTRDYAPHDAGRYPILNGQYYYPELDEKQMPVEECGNMIIMSAALSVALGDASFAMENIDTLTKWARYLIDFGADPDNQLCTDDFAGHLAHNCNLSLKAISGLIGMSKIFEISGDRKQSAYYMKLAKKMASEWLINASNGDGSYRLAFDRPGSFSMKYNAIWDLLFGTEVFPKSFYVSETASNMTHFLPYGMPLDNRERYTKSDWLVWTATLSPSRDVFKKFVHLLWKAYNYSSSRVPMTDWYWADTSLKRGFQHRSVQGGLFIKLLQYYGKMNRNF